MQCAYVCMHMIRTCTYTCTYMYVLYTWFEDWIHMFLQASYTCMYIHWALSETRFDIWFKTRADVHWYWISNVVYINRNKTQATCNCIHMCMPQVKHWNPAQEIYGGKHTFFDPILNLWVCYYKPQPRHVSLVTPQTRKKELLLFKKRVECLSLK